MPPPVGLCDRCLHQRVVRNTRGSTFSLCRRSTDDERYPKYPPTPVLRCPGFERDPVDGEGEGEGEGVECESSQAWSETVAIRPDGLRTCVPMMHDTTPPRCWPTTDPLYIAYHDDEWGRPVRDDRLLLERLCLEGFQSGLSWITILRKRPRFREVFHDFDPQTVAAFGEPDIERLLGDAAIIRHRGKIEATIANARATVALHEGGETLTDLLWSFAPLTDPPPSVPAALGEMPSWTAESKALARELKRRGFRFVGPTTAYALMQATGIVNDHLADCIVRDEVEAARAMALG